MEPDLRRAMTRATPLLEFRDNRSILWVPAVSVNARVNARANADAAAQPAIASADDSAEAYALIAIGRVIAAMEEA